MRSDEFVLTLLDFRHNQEAGFMPLMAAVEGLNAKQASWRPNEKSHSIWQLLNHITFWNEYILGTIRDMKQGNIEIHNEHTFGPPGDPNDEMAWKRAVERASEVYQALRQAVSDLSESDLEKPFDEKGTPIKLVLADIAMHDAYHIGQIVYIRKLQGWTRAT
jgi:uncharacterized damage-inducible protein DinB